MTTIQLKRGSKEKLDQYLGQEGELCVDTDSYGLRVFDGATVGGYQIGVTDVIDAEVIPESKDKTVILTVGFRSNGDYDGDDYHDIFGYRNTQSQTFGSMNRIPYWIRNGKKLKLTVFSGCGDSQNFGSDVLDFSENLSGTLDKVFQKFTFNATDYNKGKYDMACFVIESIHHDGNQNIFKNVWIATEDSYHYYNFAFATYTTSFVSGNIPKDTQLTLKFTPEPDGFDEVS